MKTLIVLLLITSFGLSSYLIYSTTEKIKREGEASNQTFLDEYVAQAIFTIFKLLQTQDVVDKEYLVKKVVDNLYPNVEKYVSKSVFRGLIEQSYVFMEGQYDNLIEELEDRLEALK